MLKDVFELPSLYTEKCYKRLLLSVMLLRQSKEINIPIYRSEPKPSSFFSCSRQQEARSDYKYLIYSINLCYF